MLKKSTQLYLFLFISSLVFFSSTFEAQTLKWQQLGDPTFNTTIYDLAIAPNGTIWVLSNNIVFSSTDRGVNWTKRTYVTDNISSAIAVSPKGYIYAAGKSAVTRSTDNGQTWTRKIIDQSIMPVNKIKFAPGGQVIAISGYSSEASSVYLSSDDGDTWSKQSVMTNNNEILDIAFSSSGKYIISTRNGIFTSTNKGVTWANSNLTQGSYSAVVRSKSGTLYSGAWDKIYSSKDEGQTWDVSYLPNSQTTISYMAADSSGAVWACDAWSIFKTSDNGQSWKKVQSLSYTYNLSAYSLTTDQNNCLYAGCSPGVAWSSDGITWSQIGKGINNSYTGGIFANSNGDLYTYYSSKLYFSKDKGVNWQENSLQYPGISIDVVTKDPKGNLLVGGQGYTAISTDNGTTWQVNPIGDKTPRVFNFAFDQDGKVFAGTSNGCFSSIDNGKTWVQLCNYTGSYKGLIAIDKNGNLFFAAKDAVYRSTNKGAAWTKVTPSFSSSAYALIVNRKGYIYLGTNSMSMFYSTDNGTTWQQKSIGGKSNSTIVDLAEAADGTIYASASGGLYYSKNDGADWILYDTDVERLTNIGTMCFDKNGYMYTSSMGTGMLKSTQSMLKILSPEIDSIIPGARSIKITWKKSLSPEFKEYRIYAGEDHYPAALAATISDVNLTSNVIEYLKSNKRYYFVVSVIDKSGNESFSDEQSAIPLLAPVPPAAKLAEFVNGSVNVSIAPVLKWNKYIYGDSYYLQVTTDSTFNIVTYAASAIPDTFKQVSPELLHSTKYYWRVKTQNDAGDGPWSGAWTFTTVIAAPQSPVCVNPLNNAKDLALNQTLKWNRALTADSYHLQLSTDQNFSSFVVNDSTLTDTSKAVQLTNETKYYWRVRARNLGGSSPWSDTFNFVSIVAVPAIPVMTYPVNNAVNIPVDCTFKWLKSLKAEKYRFVLATDSLFKNIVADDSLVTDSLKRINPLVNKTKYYWKAKAVNVGGESGWTAIWSFTTIIAAPAVAAELIEPYKNTLDLPVNLTLKWKPVKETDKYRLQVSTLQDFSSFVIDDSTLTDTTKQLTSLKNKTIYYWRVQARNIGGVSPWSEVWNFTTIVAMPGVVQLNTPVNNAKNISKDAKLSWVQLPDVQTYRLQVSEDSLFAKKVVDDSTITTNSKDVTLQTGMKYYWRVNAANVAGTSGYSQTWSFITILPACEELKSVTVSATALKLSWLDKSDSETGFILERKSDKETSFTLRARLTKNVTEYTDSTLPKTTYTYRIKAYNDITESSYSNELSVTTNSLSVEKTLEVPVEYALKQNYPNPFNPSTVIKYSLLKESHVKLEVYNSIGALVEVLTDKIEQTGVYEKRFNANNLSSGIYYYSIQILSVDGKDNYRSVKKMMLIK